MNFKFYIIEDEPVYVYSEQSGRSKIINALPPGSRIRIAFNSDGWYKLVNSGWIIQSPNIVLDKDQNYSINNRLPTRNKIVNVTSLSEDAPPDDPNKVDPPPDDTENQGDPEDDKNKETDAKDKDREEWEQGWLGSFSGYLDRRREERLRGADATNDETAARMLAGDFRIDGMRGVFGMPYQFSADTDVRIRTERDGSTSADVSGNDALFGRLYSERIAARAPILILQAGIPDFMGNMSEVTRAKAGASILDFLTDGNVGEAAATALKPQLESVVNGSGKYYTFRESFTEYFNAVNNMCRGMAALIGIGSVRIPYPGGASEDEGSEQALSSYNWRKAYIYSQDPAYDGSVAFYVHADPNVNESFGNGTRQSQLLGTINQVSDMAAEVQFLLGATMNGTRLQGLIDATSQAKVATDDNAAKSVGSTGLIGALMNNIDTLMAGGKMIFPEIWSDSQHIKQYSVTLKFDSPDCDNLSIYLNILVPLAHVLGMAMPRRAGDNGYVSPFIVRAFYKSMFHIEMGIITDCQITRGDVQAWTVTGLPTQVTVTLTIKDLYDVLSMSAGENLDDLIGNPAELDYLANLCGINLAVPNLSRTIELWRALRNPSTAFADRFLNFTAGLVGIFRKAYNNVANTYKL